MNLPTCTALLGLCLLFTGCEKQEAPPAPPPAPPATQAGGPDHAGGDEHADPVALGQQTANGLTFAATQDESITPGGEGAFDLVITGASDKPEAVRFWVGAEDARGSVKAKADEESANTWHTHVEIPDPLPAGAKFWAEIEPATGPAFKVSFDLKK